MRTLAPLLLAAALSWSAGAPPPGETALRRSIRTSGEATVTAKPDRAVIDVGVVTQGATAQAAAAENAQQLDAALCDMKEAAGPTAQIKTIGYSLDPNYRYPQQGGQPSITGYTARNVVEVATDDIAAAGKIIEAATRSGANMVQSLRFTLKNDREARAQALREAAIRARADADSIAAALGVQILGVLSAEESVAPQPRPIAQPMARMAEAAAPTPVAPGTIDIHAAVTLTIEIGDLARTSQ
jgi:uncharacterized protein YggE